MKESGIGDPSKTVEAQGTSGKDQRQKAHNHNNTRTSKDAKRSTIVVINRESLCTLCSCSLFAYTSTLVGIEFLRLARMTMETEETPITTVTSPKQDVVDVTVHPLVLLSAADHYHRVARGTRKRVVGILLGSVSRGRVDATNSFAVPFEEDNKNPAVFYLDHNYLENMLTMFRKVNAKERVVGFYSTGPQIRPNDLRIHDIVQRFASPTVFCIIDIRPDRASIPTTAYKVVEQVEGSGVRLDFAHVPSLIGAMEAEEVGVEHLLRDINDPTVSTVASLIKAKMSGLTTLAEKLLEMKDYLENCDNPNQDIVANMQTILNLLPNLNTDEMVRAMLVKTNDMHMAIYLSALIRSVIALHDLVNNKIRYGEKDGQAEEKKEAEETKKEETTDKE